MPYILRKLMLVFYARIFFNVEFFGFRLVGGVLWQSGFCKLCPDNSWIKPTLSHAAAGLYPQAPNNAFVSLHSE